MLFTSLDTLEYPAHHTVPAHYGFLRLESVVRSRTVDIVGKAQKIVQADHLVRGLPAQLRRQALVLYTTISTR